MFSLLKEECERTKKRMEEDPFYRWQEEHRNFMYTLSNAASFLTYYLVANKGLGPKGAAGGPKGDVDALRNGNARVISNMSKEELKASLPEGWSYSEYNGRVHIKDANGNYRVRIDPPDKVTNYQHMHIYDEHQNPINIQGNIVDPKSPDAHIPWDK